MPVFVNTQYILLLPGRHEIWFHIMGQTLLQTFWITNKKYIDVQKGHAYLLKTKGGGLVTIGDKWYPELVDVTNDPNLNVTNEPSYASAEYDRTENSSVENYENTKLTIPTMKEGVGQ